MIKPTAYQVLRIGMAITFLWIGIFIFRQPEAWGGLLQPWAAGLLPLPLKTAMIATAILDLLIGLFLLLNFFTLPVSVVGVAHIAVVLITTGVNEITVRDLGLLAATIALALTAWQNK